MADVLALNAINKLNKKLNEKINDLSDNISTSEMCVVSHYPHKVDIYCNSCGFTVPSSASEMIIEMWGQGGGGGGACCCQWGVYGGRGGDYGKVTVDVSTKSDFVMCGCSCYNATCCHSCTGSVGAFSRLCLCDGSAPKTWCVKGGSGGINNCHWMQSGSCHCNLDFSLNRTNTDLVVLHCSNSYDANFLVGSTGGIDLLFPKVSCDCFDEYRRGSMGFSGLEGDTCCQNAAGHGGASYAGGGPQYKNGSIGNWAHHGCTGNFPGGGGSGAGACGGGCCYGSQGGNGLIRVSWN